MDSLTTRFDREVVANFTALLRSQYQVHPRFDGIRQQWEDFLQNPAQLINGPFLEAASSFAPGEPLDVLPLAEAARQTISSVMGGRPLYKHQSDALKLILGESKNVVVATGTSSGKTRCFQFPILDDLIRDPSPGLRAIIIYPMNALVNDQLQDWERLLASHPQITFARFTGQTPGDEDDYRARLRKACRARLKGMDPDLLADAEHVLFQKEMAKAAAIPNHLRHRHAIRRNPPHILVTNFSMLEYLLVRPVDAPVFEGARLKFIVLDEAHAYRSVQATEIAFLLRRLKDRLDARSPVCIATSATLGKAGDPASEERVRRFAEGLFGEPFEQRCLIYGTPRIIPPPPNSLQRLPDEYLAAAAALEQHGKGEDALIALRERGVNSLREFLERDRNVYRLRTELLKKPAEFSVTASALFGNDTQREIALSALLALAATADAEQTGNEALLPTRLHYFLRAQDGLHACLREDCPARRGDVPAVYSSRLSENDAVREGDCPACHEAGRVSRLVELVTCRRCGWLYGALRDLGPARARAKRETGATAGGTDAVPPPSHDSFDTDLGWAPQSWHTYFSMEPEFSFPHPIADDPDDAKNEKLLFRPESAAWCAVCGKRELGTPDACQCGSAIHRRTLVIFHRQCPTDEGTEALEQDVKHMLGQCPNCLARNTFGVEPVRRFQESDDEAGLAAAIPFGHFDVSPWVPKERWQIRKLLCFADQRQKAATFPALLEDEAFPWDLGREITRIVQREDKAFRFTQIADALARQHTDDTLPAEEKLLLPYSVRPDDEDTDWKEYFTAHVFAYFGVPDSARDSAEDFGVLRVRYELAEAKRAALAAVLQPYGLAPDDCEALLQTLFGFARKRKAFRLPEGVNQKHPAFGRVTADICFAKERGGRTSVEGFVAATTSPAGNEVTNYLSRVLGVGIASVREVAAQLWDAICANAILRNEDTDKYRLIPSLLYVEPAPHRFCCDTCRTITAWNCRSVCPKKECRGVLGAMAEPANDSRLVVRWVSGQPDVPFQSLASEEHTAQIAKDVAALIEEEFRGAGVNLLSSTTTFEMGINIGDLQKVLLRNAPPNPASYIQRVGRAGRGADKNAVCVTLCKGTKYDLDCWRSPAQRLMSGTVTPPSVFLDNAHLAQRHLNAFFFAAALRANLAVLGVLGRKQQIPLAVCIPASDRQDLAATWFPRGTQNINLDLLAAISAIPLPSSDSSPLIRLAQTVGGWPAAKANAVQSYGERMTAIIEDLRAFLDERKERFSLGQPTVETERAIQSLLKADMVAILAKRGFLPRYAFPLDVVELVTKEDRYSESDVELTRDRGLAIAEYAPGAQVVARKQLFTSGGIAFSSRKEIPDPEWFWRCPDCQLIRTELTRTKLLESLGDKCPVCGRAVLEAAFHRFIQPLAFMHDKRAKASFGRTKPIRQRQSLTHFIDSLEGAEFSHSSGFEILLKKDGKLFRYNRGPANRDFRLCRLCGRSEPVPAVGALPPNHRWLRYLPAFSAGPNCTAQFTSSVAYGHVFQSFCLVVRPRFAYGSRESLGYALHRGLCSVLELDLNELGVSFRRGLTGGDEIVFYDKAPGGAGLVQDGRDRWDEVIVAATHIVTRCSCETACYNCLKDFSNQTHHEILDRNLTGLSEH